MNSSTGTIIFRVDGDNRIGLGHISRCIALSEMLNRHFSISFIVSNPSESIAKLASSYGRLIRLVGDNIEDEYKALNAILSVEDICVLDGYHFGEEYQRFVKTRVRKVVIIDDLADKHYFADLIINAGSSSIRKSYSVSAHTKVLSGFDYVLLRPEFISAAKQARRIHKVDTAFICMGGADPNYVTKKVLKACLLNSFIRNISVLVGSAFTFYEDLKTIIETYEGGVEISLLRDISPLSIVSLMSSADICIVPSSTVSLEVCCVKSGLLTGVTFDNQKLIHEQLLQLGAAASVGNFNDASIEGISSKVAKFKSVKLINKMVMNQRKAIDGKSPVRILKQFKTLMAC